jgi:RNA polymerase sigma-70 factor, ECF subfamily
MQGQVWSRGDGRETAPPESDAPRIDSAPVEPIEPDDLVRPSQPRGLNLDEALEKARAGDEVAFRTIYRTLQPGFLRYLRGLVAQDAEDVASEAWAQVARDLGSFRGDPGGFRAWVATIGRHRALDHLRRQRRRPVIAMAVEDLPDAAGSDDTEAQSIDAVSTDAAVALIAALPPDQAEAVLLRVVMGLDAVSAGRVLGKRPGAVRTAAHRGLRRLAEQLDGGTAPGSPGTAGSPESGGRHRPHGV